MTIPGSTRRAGWALLVMLIGVSAQAETPEQRGDYLVNTVMACQSCHTPLGPNGPIAEKRFSGGSQTFDMPLFTVKGANVTPDRETGIGTWSDADLRRALVDGVRPDSRPLALMPSGFFKALTPSDLDAVIAYLKGVPAVHHVVDAPVLRELPHLVQPPADALRSGADTTDPVQRGLYLATLGHCMECHARGADQRHDFVQGLGRGGAVVKGEWGAVKVPNITSHPTAGIGGWSDVELQRALTESVGRDGHPFKTPMRRGRYLSGLTPDDMAALIAYLRSLPPLD